MINFAENLDIPSGGEYSLRKTFKWTIVAALQGRPKSESVQERRKEIVADFLRRGTVGEEGQDSPPGQIWPPRSVKEEDGSELNVMKRNE